MSTTLIHQISPPRVRSNKSGALDRAAGAVSQLLTELGVASTATNASNLSVHVVALEGRDGSAYNEAGFRYFLGLEEKRAERSGRPFLLLLVDLGDGTAVDDGTARQLFSALAMCLRETDFMGWYRTGRAAGAVLTQIADIQSATTSHLIAGRVEAALRKELPGSVSDRLRLRVQQMPSSPQIVR